MALSLKRYHSSHSKSLHGILKERSQKEREMSIVMSTMTSDPLPEDVVIEILSRLPVKKVLQFKCVCKSWYAILTSPNFISKHLEYYYNNSEGGGLFAQYYVSHAELQLFELLVDETPRVLSSAVLYGMPMYGSHVCGPCDGIYYLYDYDFGNRALWNPAIDELKLLPPILITKPNLPSNLTYSKLDIYGFGLDPVTKDYKVVVIKGYWSKSDDEDDIKHPLSVLVYSFRTNSWRYWGDLAHDYFLDNNKCYVCLNGVFHWLGLYERDGDSEVIIRFDMVADAFQEIQVPDYEKPASKSLALFQDSIALLSVHEMKKFFDIWTLNDGCWTKKITIGPIEGLGSPVGHWMNDKLILASTSRELMLCDPITQEVRGLGFHGNTTCQGISAYKESLVSIKDKNGCRQDEEAETESNCQVSHSSFNQNDSDSEEEYFLMYSNSDEIGYLFD